MNTSPSLSDKGSPEARRGVTRWAVKSLFFVIINGLVLFLSAGTRNWTWGWIYLGVTVFILMLDALILNPELLAERSKMQEGTKRWDPLLASAMAIWGPLAMWIVAGLDQRWAWTGPFPGWLRITGLALAVGGSLFTIWAMTANPFFSGTVRIQAERGHKVSNSGPYAHLRHPGYLGSILFDLGVPLILGSWWALLPAGLTILFAMLRTHLEDKTLQEELNGYRQYARIVRYRLFPGLW